MSLSGLEEYNVKSLCIIITKFTWLDKNKLMIRANTTA